mmetsp:Transcript_22175/g.38008  ORF Transcript_22175/g.38008 Transcript_22175/m.38008 type:complete len:170 (+) Transcript_22175:179-688(+)
MSCPFKSLHAVTPSGATPPPKCGGAINKLVIFMQGHADAAFLLDREGKILYRNKAAQLMFLSDVNQMNICSLFSFTQSHAAIPGSSDCWDDIAKSLSTSEPQYHDVVVMENDGELGFRINLVKLPADLLGEGNNDVFACAYVTPAHDHEHNNGKKECSPYHCGRRHRGG